MRKCFYPVIFVFVLLLIGCSEHKHSMAVFQQIEENNALVKRERENNLDLLKLLSLLPGKQMHIRPFLEKQQDILKISKEVYDHITREMIGIMEENGIEFRIQSDLTMSDPRDLLLDKIEGDIPYKYAGEDEVFGRMETFANKVSSLLCNYKEQNREYSLRSYYKRPSYKKDIANFKYDGINRWDEKELRFIMETLLIPKKTEDGKETGESLFGEQCLLGTLEQLNLLRNRILMVTDKATAHITERALIPSFNFNKVEPFVYRVPGSVNDSIRLKVFILAYDSTEMPQVRYSVNGDGVIRDAWSYNIMVAKNARTVEGHISVKQDGIVRWKPWIYRLRD